ncbi:MAG: D-alanyl-D-alanine carboxypeptidase/D-alanyl-D-alanine-endopeptidase [Syntrophobacteraceae bacterium]|nr:D-alanyl-D-alanine carboxypeptidase/D-alanyl-D-alanine-endopeptidase [Desulfobacteraceae bacterium]
MPKMVFVKILKILLYIGPILLASAAAAAGPEEMLRPQLDALQKSAGDVGIQVIALPSGKPVWEYRAAEPLVPASLVKVLTSYAALKRLGPGHHYQTSLWALDGPKGDAIPGDLWIRGDGDPYLVAEKASALAAALRESGVRSIHGGICIDNGAFSPPSERVCLDGQCGRNYEPVLSATAVDFNSITFRVSPGAKTGSPVRVSWSPAGDYVRMTNRAVTGGKGAKTPLRLQSLGMAPDGHEKFELTGRLPARGAGEREFRLNVADPAFFAGYTYKALLREAGIEIRGAGVKVCSVPAGAKKILESGSQSLGEILFGLNRYSNNFMAEMVLRNMGGRTGEFPATAEKGLAVVRRTLGSLGIPEGEVSLDCGSGLSRNCRVSPRTFGKVLAAVYADPSIAPDFMASLAVSSQDGTLRRRAHPPGIVLRGKTGSLSDVAAIAGYVEEAGRDVCAVTIICNDVRDPAAAKAAMHAFIDRAPGLVRALAAP